MSTLLGRLVTWRTSKIGKWTKWQIWDAMSTSMPATNFFSQLPDSSSQTWSLFRAASTVPSTTSLAGPSCALSCTSTWQENWSKFARKSLSCRRAATTPTTWVSTRLGSSRLCSATRSTKTQFRLTQMQASLLSTNLMAKVPRIGQKQTLLRLARILSNIGHV